MSRSSNIGVHANGPVMKRPSFSGSWARTSDAVTRAASRTTVAARMEAAVMSLSRDWRFDALDFAVVGVDQTAVWTPRGLRRIDKQLTQFPVFEPLPQIDSAVAVRVLFRANGDPFLVHFMTIRDAVAPGRDIHPHLVTRLHHPRVLDTIGLARCPESLEFAIGPVVLPSVDDAVAVAVRLDANGPAIDEIRPHVDMAVAIGVVVDAPDRPRRVIDRRDAITGARTESRAHQYARA